MSFHFFVFYFCFYSIPRLTHKQECPRRLPGQCPVAEIPEALAVTGTPAEGRVKALQVQRERVKALQVPRVRVKARSQGSIAKVKASFAGESRQVPREHRNVIERSLDCLIHKDQNVRLHNYYSLSSKSLLILYHLIFK